jgi:superfamily II DNA or RNA helicase/HKD family nuclease
MSDRLPFGIYDKLIDEGLREALSRHPELRSILGKIDPEEEPFRYSAFIGKVVEQALREKTDPSTRLELCNRLISVLAGNAGLDHLDKHRLVDLDKPVLLEITPPHMGSPGIPRPQTSVSESSLFTGSPNEPQLAHELAEEMRSADQVDILVSFIKWTGLRLLMPAFEELRTRDVPVRLITTSYMGASDPPAVEWLSKLPNVRIRVSYDTERTRLHAKAYHFRRSSGFSTAYIGSANMSHAAITSGLEWNLKITSQDMGHILEKFAAEFETYWNSREFLPFDPADPMPFRRAIARAGNNGSAATNVFFDLFPHPFQERILEALERERTVFGLKRNLVIAATGTGKTVIAAFDFKRFYEERRRQARLLFVAHRHQILEQAMLTFRNVLRDGNFGELFTGNTQPIRMEHLFCSVPIISTRGLWNQVGPDYYDFIVIDEAHHETAASYRPVFEHFRPEILLGLTATPERMDGESVVADFGNRFAAEIRLPEALEEKLLCPFHYFGVADPVALDQDKFWKNGKYDPTELENVYTGAHALAQQRLDAIIESLDRYEPVRDSIKGLGFCVSIRHAKFMAEMFTKAGIPSAALVADVTDRDRPVLVDRFKDGQLKFLFTVDLLSEGVDIPEINTVLFLRPTESLTVFLQQLGRGLRNHPEKDCLTVIDLVGQAHRFYRIDSKFKALLPKHRFSIEHEAELDFPHLPAGSSIQLDKISRRYVLDNIRSNLRNLAIAIPDRLQTFTTETGRPLTFGNFIRHHDYDPAALLVRETWSQWKSKARLSSPPEDPDLQDLKKALVRTATVTGPKEIAYLRGAVRKLIDADVPGALEEAAGNSMRMHYRVWGRPGNMLGIGSIEESFSRLARNRSILSDLDEILAWAAEETRLGGTSVKTPFPCNLELHAQYGSRDILAAFGKAGMDTPGQTGVGVLHFEDIKAYVLLITFRKTEREFSPSTMYADYPISRELLHWESQSQTAQRSLAGQNLIHHMDRGYTVLLFARDQKKKETLPVPFTFLGPADLVQYESERPIKMVWRLHHPMPVEMFEENRRGG